MMMSKRIEYFTRAILKPFSKTIILLSLIVLKTVIYLSVFFSLLFLLDTMLKGVPSMTPMRHLLGIIASLIDILISIFYVIATAGSAKSITLLSLSIKALFAHVFVGMAQSLLSPLFAMFGIVNVLMSNIVVDSALKFDSSGNVIGPATCQDGYPLYKYGDLIAIHDFLQDLINADIPWISNNAKTISNTPLFPVDVLKNAFGIIETALSPILTEYSGMDILKYYLGQNEFVFDSSGNVISGESSGMFSSVIQSLISKATGCT